MGRANRLSGCQQTGTHVSNRSQVGHLDKAEDSLDEFSATVRSHGQKASSTIAGFTDALKALIIIGHKSNRLDHSPPRNVTTLSCGSIMRAICAANTSKACFFSSRYS